MQWYWTTNFAISSFLHHDDMTATLSDAHKTQTFQSADRFQT